MTSYLKKYKQSKQLYKHICKINKGGAEYSMESDNIPAKLDEIILKIDMILVDVSKKSKQKKAVETAYTYVEHIGKTMTLSDLCSFLDHILKNPIIQDKKYNLLKVANRTVLKYYGLDQGFEYLYAFPQQKPSTLIDTASALENLNTSESKLGIITWVQSLIQIWKNIETVKDQESINMFWTKISKMVPFELIIHDVLYELISIPFEIYENIKPNLVRIDDTEEQKKLDDSFASFIPFAINHIIIEYLSSNLCMMKASVIVQNIKLHTDTELIDLANLTYVSKVNDYIVDETSPLWNTLHKISTNNKNPLLVGHYKHFKKPFGGKTGIMSYIIPFGLTKEINDDWIIIYLSLQNKLTVHTNDLYSDHFNKREYYHPSTTDSTFYRFQILYQYWVKRYLKNTKYIQFITKNLDIQYFVSNENQFYILYDNIWYLYNKK